MNIPFYRGENKIERGDFIMFKGNTKVLNKQKVNTGTKRTEASEHQEKSARNKQEEH